MFNFGKERALPTLLVIDDDMVSREVMATVLTMSGFPVHTADDGVTALEALDAALVAPDVILMDTQMPGLSGVGLIQELRRHSRAVIYAISASDATDDVIAAANGFLLKPLTSDAMRKLVEDFESRVTTPGIPGGSASSPAPAQDQTSEDPIVSAATLAQLRGLMPNSAVKEIYAAVVADLKKRLAALDAAIATGNTAEIRRIGHAIKGGCAMAGAMRAARLGALLEAEGNHLDNSAATTLELRAAHRDLERMLEIEFKA